MDENNNQNNLKFSDNENSFKNATSSSKTTYSSFENNKKQKKSGNSFGKTVLLPFTCGILGAGIVIGTCFRSSKHKKRNYRSI